MSPTQITGRTGGRPATFADYDALFQTERPLKFSADEVGFVFRGIYPKYTCGRCAHFFVNPVSSRAVCEIMRLPGEQPVPARGSCRFWNTGDGRFPLL